MRGWEDEDYMENMKKLKKFVHNNKKNEIEVILIYSNKCIE